MASWRSRLDRRLGNGRLVVSDVSPTIPAGEVSAARPNGAGKSSLVLGVAGVLKPESGTVSSTAGPPADGPSGSARPAWRSCPRAGGCCPS